MLSCTLEGLTFVFHPSSVLLVRYVFVALKFCFFQIQISKSPNAGIECKRNSDSAVVNSPFLLKYLNLTRFHRFYGQE